MSFETSKKRAFKGFLTRKEANVLTYHSVLPKQANLFQTPYHIDEDLFHEQMEYLAHSKFNCLTLSQLREALDRHSLPKHAVVITFDDGFYNNFSTALPILEKFNIPATVFISTGLVGQQTLGWPEMLISILQCSACEELTFKAKCFPIASADDKQDTFIELTKEFASLTADEIQQACQDFQTQTRFDAEQFFTSSTYEAMRFLTWDEIDAMKQSPVIEFGSHGVTHRSLIHLPDAESRQEINASKHTIQQRIGHCQAFAYPFGRRGVDFNEQHDHMAKEAGYQLIFTCGQYRTIKQTSNPLDLPRTNILSDCDIDVFDLTLNGGISFNNLGSTKEALSGVMKGLFSGSTH